MVNPNMPILEQTESLSYNSKWEFPRNRLTFGKEYYLLFAYNLINYQSHIDVHM